MGKPHPMALRERVAAYVDEGHGHREAARHFCVSPRFVNELMKLRRETGSVARLRRTPASRARADGSGRRTDAGRTVRRVGSTRRGRPPLKRRSPAASPRPQPQKTLQASEQQRPEIREARDLWIKRRRRFFNKALSRLVFIDVARSEGQRIPN
jgi:hypothetical protein